MKTENQILSQPKAGILSSEFALINHNDINTDTLLMVLKQISLKYDLKNVLLDILNNEERLREVANHSYSHNNGFDKIVIDSFSEFGLKLRLHIWWNDSTYIKESSVHNHPWDFASHLVIGNYVMKLYEETKYQGVEYIKTYYPTLAKAEQTVPIIENEKVKLCCTKEYFFEAHSFYSLKHSIYHSVIMPKPKRVAATLVLQGKHISNMTTVYSKTNESLNNPFEVAYFNTEEIKHKLLELYKLL